MAAIEWTDGAPIYRQLKERVVAMLLDGVLKPGDALPSVRQVAAEYQLNPITVSRAYQELADDQLVEKRRGLGMYVTDGAATRLMSSEREHFLREEWPLVVERIQRLGLEPSELLDSKNKWGKKGLHPSPVLRIKVTSSPHAACAKPTRTNWRWMAPVSIFPLAASSA
jgi:GntR family transcriptional regulator